MKRSFIILVALSVVSASFAAARSVEQAAEIAAQFTNAQAPLRRAYASDRTALTMRLVMTQTKLESNEPAYYVFNQENNGGFVIVSGDDLAPDVLVYSDEGAFDSENINPNFQFWLKHIQEELSVINEENAAPKRITMEVLPIGPLLVNNQGKSIEWAQESPYYNLCPIDNTTKSRCLTGCVATAAAQIMYMWRHPEQGVGTHSYLWRNPNQSTQTETLTANYGETTYDWGNMLPHYRSSTTTEAQKNAVATLMYHCGVACEMRYGGDASGSFTDIMGYGLKEYFNYNIGKFLCSLSKAEYSPRVTIPSEWKVTTDQFVASFNEDLEAGRPILMGGQDKSDGGHEFVCDGRDANGKFHINWGWGGSSNCYCELTALKPSGTSMNFSTSIDAIVGIEPVILDTVHVESITVAPASMTLKINQKEQLTATIYPEDASVRTFTWSCSDSTKVRVNADGTIKGLAQGNALVVATTKDGGFKDTCYVTVTSEILEPSECPDYSYTFVNKCVKGYNILGEYSWFVKIKASKIGNVVADKGQQFGTTQEAPQEVSLTTSGMEDCIISNVDVEASIMKGADGQLAVYINGTQIGSTTTLSATSKSYSFVNTNQLQGDLEIRLTNTSKAMYIKSIKVRPNATGWETIEANSTSHKYMENGRLVIEYNGTKYSVLGAPIR